MGDDSREVGRDLGQNDARVADYVANIAKTVGDRIVHVFDPVVDQYAKLFKEGARTPVLRRPSDYGMAYEDCFFPSADGTPLEAWYIPAPGSDRLLIINHPLGCNRYGYPGHLPPWHVMFGGFEVNFLPELRHLHHAGYNILTYDLRNCGMSGEANGNTGGLGLLECRDVLGSVRYAQGRPDLAKMTTGLYGRCVGANAIVVAMAKWPGAFAHIRALVLLNAVSGRTFIEKAAEMMRMDPVRSASHLDERLRDTTGFRLDELTPRPHGHAVKTPTLMAQLRREFLIHAERNGQEIYDALGAETKELLWIEESNQRFYAFNHFGLHPERLIGWFDQHMRGKGGHTSGDIGDAVLP